MINILCTVCVKKKKSHLILYSEHYKIKNGGAAVDHEDISVLIFIFFMKCLKCNVKSRKKTQWEY